MHDRLESTTGLGFLLNEVTNRWRQILDRRLRPQGLSQATWRALFHLECRCEGLPQRDLAESMGIEGPSLVRLLDTLQGAGLIERRESPSDRRAKLVRLTPEARAVLADIHRTAAQLRTELLDGIAADELATCVSVLRRVNANAAKLKSESQ